MSGLNHRVEVAEKHGTKYANFVPNAQVGGVLAYLSHQARHRFAYLGQTCIFEPSSPPPICVFGTDLRI